MWVKLVQKQSVSCPYLPKLIITCWINAFSWEHSIIWLNKICWIPLIISMRNLGIGKVLKNKEIVQLWGGRFSRKGLNCLSMGRGLYCSSFVSKKKARLNFNSKISPIIRPSWKVSIFQAFKPYLQNGLRDFKFTYLQISFKSILNMQKIFKVL